MKPFYYMNDPKIIVPDEQTLDRMMTKVKVALFRKKGATFLASMLCQVEIIWDENIPTACTNGKEIRWNPKFFMILPFETRQFVLAHEVWHIAFMHCNPEMRIRYDPQIFNIAADHVINTMLLHDGFTDKGIPFEICKEFKYHEWSVDKVYHDLYENNPPPPSGGSGHPDDPDDDGSPSDQGASGGTNPGKYPMADDIRDTPGGTKGTDEIIKNVVSAVQAAKLAGEAGSIPGNVEQIIKEYLHPILPWETLVQQWLNEKAQSDYSYARPNRRFDDPILPSLVADNALEELNWYIDVSGSISDQMIMRFFSEIKYVIETFLPVKVNIIQFDCDIQKITEIEAGDDFTELQVIGRGGTSLEPVHEHIQKTNPTAAIIFSDMECSPMEYISTPILWAVFHAPGNKFFGHKPTFGTVIDVIERKPL